MALLQVDDTDTQPLGLGGLKNYFASKKNQERKLTFGEPAFDGAASSVVTANGKYVGAITTML